MFSNQFKSTSKSRKYKITLPLKSKEYLEFEKRSKESVERILRKHK